MFTDILGVLSIVVGALLYIAVYNSFITVKFGHLMHSSPLLFWPLILFGLILFYTIGQYTVLGLASAILVAIGKLSVSEAFYYSVFYKMPKKWLKNVHV